MKNVEELDEVTIEDDFEECVDVEYEEVDPDAQDEEISYEIEEDPVEEQSPAKSNKNKNALTSKKSSEVSTNVLSGIKLDFGDISLPGITQGTLGIKVSPYPVERMKFSKDSKSLISVVSEQVIAIKTHFSEECGSYLCFEGECCNRDGMPRVKYLLPIVVYDTDKTGRPVTQKIENYALSIGKDQYEELITVKDLNGSLVGLDLLVTCSDENYQKISFHTAGQARWMKSKKVINEVSKFWAKNSKDIIKSTARTLTVAQWREKVGESTPAVLSEDAAFDDAFND